MSSSNAATKKQTSSTGRLERIANRAKRIEQDVPNSSRKSIRQSTTKQVIPNPSTESELTESNPSSSSQMQLDNDDDDDDTQSNIINDDSSDKGSNPNSNSHSAGSTTKSELRVLLRAEKIQKVKRKQKLKDLTQENLDLKSKDQLELEELRNKNVELQEKLELEKAETTKQRELAEKYHKLWRDGETERLNERLAERAKASAREKLQLEQRIQEIGVFEVLREKNPEQNEEETRSERLERKARQAARINTWLSGHSKRLCTSPIDFEPSEPSTFENTEMDEGQQKEDFEYPDLMCWTRSEAKSLALKEKVNKGKNNSFVWNNPRHFLRDASGDALYRHQVDEIRNKVQALLREHLIENKRVRKEALISMKEYDRSHIDFNKLTPTQISDEVDCYLLNDLFWKSVRYNRNYKNGFRNAINEYRLDISWCDDDWKLEELVKAELTKMRSDGKIKVAIRDHEYEKLNVLKKKSKKRKASSSLVKQENTDQENSDEDVKFEIESSTSDHSWKQDNFAEEDFANTYYFPLNADLREIAKRLYQELSSVGNGKIEITRKLCRSFLMDSGGNTYDARKALYEHFGLQMPGPNCSLIPSRWKRTDAKRIRRQDKIQAEWFARSPFDEEDEDGTHRE